MGSSPIILKKKDGWRIREDDIIIVGNLWRNRNRLNMMKDGKFIVYTTRDGLSDNNINFHWKTRKVVYGLAPIGGLNRIITGKISVFTIEVGNITKCSILYS